MMEVSKNNSYREGILGSRNDGEFTGSKFTQWSISIGRFQFRLSRVFKRDAPPEAWSSWKEQDFPWKAKPTYSFTMKYNRRQIL